MSSSSFSQTKVRSDAKNEPQWKKTMTPEKMKQIEKAREEAKSKGLKRDPKGVYGVVCPACIKPNAVTASFCTGCSFPCTEEDVQRLPDNVFLLMVQGQDIGAKVHYRDSELIVFDDKYPVSDNHIDVIPTAVYLDISVLTDQHIPLLEKLYEFGKKQFLSRNIPWLKDQNIDDFISCGYNYPVSVKHLHIHMIIPPFKHNKVLQYPRWHTHKKVLSDLKQYGRVRLYADYPNAEEGQAEYDRAMKSHDRGIHIKKCYPI
eukprot:TRINITY_DN1825_c0_g1_i3.p1 TRINITY_DN1825_c0_g1~~TRINITY_DN1825_c0_g1_i3.p1  ORF type:complete len:260 (+),score=57.95 TRINITY_DN1825_c0_g1_i3:194-973(+)